MPALPTLRLKAANTALAEGYPWVHRKEVAITPALRALPVGESVTVVHANGKPIGSATLNLTPGADVVAYMHSSRANTPLDRELLHQRLQNALTMREAIFKAPYYRLCNGDGDSLSGLLVDRLNDVLVVQLNSAGMAARKALIADVLHMLTEPRAIVFRTQADSSIDTIGHLPEMPLPVLENGLTFYADVLEGDKVFWHYHHRDNRQHVAQIAAKQTVLDLFCQSGAIGIGCLKNGAEAATFVDISIRSIELAHISANKAGVLDKCSVLEGDAFAIIKRLIADGHTYGIVSATPPRFANTQKELKPALKIYADLARDGAKLTRSGGYLVISCNEPLIDTNLFINTLLEGVQRAHRNAQIVRVAHGDIDFPVHVQLMLKQPITSVTLRLE